MKISTKRLWLYFIAVNILWLALAIWVTMPERVLIFQGQAAAFSLRERQLSVMENNLRMYEENIASLSKFYIEEDIIIQPSGQTGTMLTDVRNMLHMRNLTEREFHASEQGSHYAGVQHVVETRASLVADGSYDNISAFLHDLANHYRYLRLERIQISEEFPQTRLWLTISIYESE